MKKMTSKAMTKANGGWYPYKKWYDFVYYVPIVNLIATPITCIANGLDNGRSGNYY